MIRISLSKTALNDNFKLIYDGKILEEPPAPYSYNKHAFVTWKCRRCGRRGKEGRPFKSTLIERANAHWYCRCPGEKSN